MKAASEKIKAENERLKKEIKLLLKTKSMLKSSAGRAGMTRPDEIIFNEKQNDRQEKQ